MNEGLSLLLSNLQSWHRWFKWGASSSIQHFGRALCLVKHNWFSVRLLPTNKSQSFCPPKMLYGEAFYPLEPQMPTVLLSLSLSLSRRPENAPPPSATPRPSAVVAPRRRQRAAERERDGSSFREPRARSSSSFPAVRSIRSFLEERGNGSATPNRVTC